MQDSKKFQTTKKEILNSVKLNFYKELKNISKEYSNKKEISGFANGIIIGEKNYPNLKINSISNQEKDSNFFNNSKNIKQDYKNILKEKAKNILGSSSNINIKNINSKIKNEIEDIYKSKQAIEFESKFEKEIQLKTIISNKTFGLIGSKNNLTNLKAIENSKTSKQIEKYTNQDIKSSKAIIELYKKGINEHQIINLLSLGSFGINLNKKLVPTKWSITAYDQTIEKYLFNEIKKFKLINNYQIFYYKDKGNTFLIILFPEEISGEVIEDMDNFYGSDYFNNYNKLDNNKPKTSGAYYSTKLAIFEYLNSIKKQAGFISIRIIENYEIPLGVIFVRESIRESMKNKIQNFSNQKELENYLIQNYKKEFQIYYKSKYKKKLKIEKKLIEFL